MKRHEPLGLGEGLAATEGFTGTAVAVGGGGVTVGGTGVAVAGGVVGVGGTDVAVAGADVCTERSATGEDASADERPGVEPTAADEVKPGSPTARKVAAHSSVPITPTAESWPVEETERRRRMPQMSNRVKVTARNSAGRTTAARRPPRVAGPTMTIRSTQPRTAA